MPTDEQMNSKTELLSRQKMAKAKGGMFDMRGAAGGLAPGIAPRDIAPPIMPDWAAAIRQPAPAAAGTVSQEGMGPGRAEAGAQDRMQQIIRTKRLGDIKNQIGLIQQAGTTGLSLEDKMARADSLRSGYYQRDLLAGQNNPVQQVQSPAQVVEGRAGINDAIHALATKSRMAALAKAGVPNDENAAFVDNPQATEARRLDAGADANLPKYGGGAGASAGLEDPRVAKVIAGQRALADRQTASKDAYAALDQPYESERRAGIAHSIATKSIGRQTELAGGEAGLAQAKAGAVPAQTTLATAPASIQSAADLAKTGAIKARTGLAATEAVSGGEQAMAAMADSRLSTQVKSFNDALAAGAGAVGDPEHAARLASSAKSIIDYISMLPPDQQAAVKQQLRSTLDLSKVSVLGSWSPADMTPLALPRLLTKTKMVHAVGQLRDFLSQ